MKKVSVIIPVYDEEAVIANCLQSIQSQTYKDKEIIIIDDGSTDKTLSIIKNLLLRSKTRGNEQLKIENLKILDQEHLGPGPARNLGAKHAKGEILVFVDADMTFDKNFVKDLTAPIIKGNSIGTFSKNEMNANYGNIWSVCWNINRGWPIDRLIPPDYPNEAPVFRAILKKEFDKVDGFDATGEYTDDWSLSKKLGVKSTLAKGAVYYHSNPDNLKEVYKQARWIGKNEFISGNIVRRMRSLVLYSLPMSFGIGVFKAILNGSITFVVFKPVYDLAVWISVIGSFFKESKSK